MNKTPNAIQSLLIPINVLDYSKVRMGNPYGDCGYVLLYEILKNDSAVYSYGIGQFPVSVSFDYDCAALGKLVFLYDDSIDKPAVNHPLFRFKKEKCVGGSIDRHVQENGHSGSENLFLKMDIEGGEYDIISSTNCLNKFSQIVIEVHDLDPRNEKQVAFFNKILTTHYIYHIHGNNCAEINDGLPLVLELSFVRKNLIKHNITTLEESCPTLLDRAVCPKKDYVLDWWIK
jgi:hypothetical protein